MTVKIIQENTYFSISEIAQISDVNVRSLRRWLDNGELAHFLTIYQTSNGRTCYRLGPPRTTDRLIDGSTLKYQFPKEDDVNG